MPEINLEELDRVETTLNYLEYTGERPAYYLYEPVPGPTPKRPERDKQPVPVFDARAIMHTLSLDENVFAVL